MLTRNERIIVEAIRNAQMVEIVIPGYGKDGDCRIKLTGRRVSHDVAIAVQTHFNCVAKRGGAYNRIAS